MAAYACLATVTGWKDEAMPRVQIVSRSGCHLCEEAERVVAEVCARTGDDYEVRWIEDDPQLADEYAEFIPVIFVDGARHDFYRVDPDRLMTALGGF
jgi:Glutaredoxin-like domain (DUF836).